MSIKNLASCASPDSIFNTGKPMCDLVRKKMKGIIFLDKGMEFMGADIASTAAFIAAVKAATYAARGSRAYPLFDLFNFEDNTGEPSTGSVGNLSTATTVTSDAVPAFRFGYNGSEARHKAMATMISQSFDVLFVDEGWAVYGTEGATGGFSGYTSLQQYVDVAKFPVSDTVNQYSFRITLADITQYRENSSYLLLTSAITTALGLINVDLVKLSNVTNVHKIQMIAAGGTNLEPTHGAAVAALTFTAKNLETDTAFTVTSVADDTALDALTITLDSAAWALLASGDRVQINPPSASALAGAGVKPFEFLPVIVTK